MMDLVNKVFTGDCVDILKGLPEKWVGACITDPPYNYEFIGKDWDHAEITRRLRHVQDSRTLVKNIPYGSGLAGGVRNQRWYERNRKNILEYQDWCRDWGKEVYRVCKPGALVTVFNSTRTAAHVQVALESVGFYARDCIVYRRPSGIPKGLNVAAKLGQKGLTESNRWVGWHSCLRNEWEAIVVVQKPLQNNYVETVMKYGVGLFHVENGHGFQSNIIENIPRDPDREQFNIHCTPKPIKLMERIIELCVPDDPDAVVLDPFAGSGTTLVAANNLGRTFVGIEINPEYVEIIRKRLQVNARDRKTTVGRERRELFPPGSF